MIHATDALKLDSAQLRPEEIAVLDKFEAQIDEQIKKDFKRTVVSFYISVEALAGFERFGNLGHGLIVDELKRRYERSGWTVIVQEGKAESPLMKGHAVLVGFQMHFVPSKESFASAGSGWFAGDVK